MDHPRRPAQRVSRDETVSESSVASAQQNVACCSSCCVTQGPGLTPENQGKGSEADARPTAAWVPALTYSGSLVLLVGRPHRRP